MPNEAVERGKLAFRYGRGAARLGHLASAVPPVLDTDDGDDQAADDDGGYRKETQPGTVQSGRDVYARRHGQTPGRVTFLEPDPHDGPNNY